MHGNQPLHQTASSGCRRLVVNPPDGGQICRNPGVLLSLGRLRAADSVHSRNLPPPSAANARRMMPCSASSGWRWPFRPFNGIGPTRTGCSHGARLHDARGTPVATAALRLSAARANGALLSGPARRPRLRSARCACRRLSFELSSKAHRSCPLAACPRPGAKVASGRPRHRRHSTANLQRHVVLPLRRIRPVQRLLQARRSARAAQHRVPREEEEGAIVLRTSHDGYAVFAT